MKHLELLVTLDLLHIERYELSNLRRLGLIKEVIGSDGLLGESKLLVKKDYNYNKNYESDENFRYYVDIKNIGVQISSDIEYELTELGELFMKACKEKE